MEIEMKKVVKSLIPIALLLAILASLAGCSGTEESTGTMESTDTESCEAHSFGEGVVTKEPYCGNEGERTFTCSVCGETKTESIPAMGEHSFSEEGEVIKNANCTETGIRRFSCTVCGATRDEEISTQEGHIYDSGVVTKEATCTEEGTRLLTCTLCGGTLEETIPIFPVVYTVTMEGFGELGVPESGVYKLPNPEKVGYKFVKWVDADDNDFPSEGVLTSDITVKPVFELLETKTVEELEERAEGGADVIYIVNDIVIDRTIYFTGRTHIVCDEAITLIRDESFAGDMFVIGEAHDGSYNVLASGAAELVLGKQDGSSSITIDGNRKNMKAQVVGSAIFIVNSSRVAMYDGVSISNHLKVGNERSVLWESVVGSSCTMGGAGVFIAHGIFDMYGGVMDNNSVNIENVGTEDLNNYLSSYGGAIYNFGTFNMYGGTIKNSAAVRGGAIFTRKQINILAGVIENNKAYNKGGAICTSESPYAEVFVGSEGAEKGTVIFRNNLAISQGGVFLGYHYTPLIVLGGALFEGNGVEKSVGGVAYTAGPVTVRDSEFINNYAFESGGVLYQYYVGNSTAPHIVTLDNCLFEGNEAGRGGVMLISAANDLKEASSVTINACEFRNNSAISREMESVDAESGETVVKTSYGSGGVIYITKKTNMTVTDTVFEGNKASVSAGAMFLTTDTETSIKNSSFEGNISTLYGGAICASGAKTLSVMSSDFTSNGLLENGIYSTEKGGAIYNGDAQVTTADCEFVGNTASIGGAMYIAGKGTYLDKEKTFGDAAVNSVFEGNISGKGGAVATYGTVEIGGAVFSANIADENGGAIYGGTDAVIVIDGCEFTKNTVIIAPDVADVRRFGGAVYGIHASLTVKNSVFTENGFEVSEDAVGVKTYGGALAASGTATVFISNSKFEANTSDYGGAVAAYDMNGNELTATSVIFKSNSSNNCGGAMYINRAKTTLSDLIAEKNSSRSGGALYVSESLDVQVRSGSVFKENSASENGGAWFVGEETVMSDSSSSFEANVAKLGGAIYINTARVTDETTGEVTVNRGEASFKGTKFTNNKANVDEVDSRGGAILVSGGILSAEDVEFTGNTATYYGGAIVGNTDSTIDLTNISFTGNSAGNNGGAIWTYFGSETTIEGISAKGNSSGGNGGFIYTRGDIKILSDDGARNIFGGESEGELNTAINGGVIYVLGPEGEGESSIIELAGADFVGNTANEGGGALYFTRSDVKVENCKLESNNAGKYGGAIQILTSNALIDGSEFTQNISVDNGGAIYVTQTPEYKALQTKSCAFEGNSSGRNGGAVYSTGTGAYIDGDDTSDMCGSIFKNNTAIGGGAMFVYGSAELYGSAFEGNIAENGGAICANVTKLSEDEDTGETVYSAGRITLSCASFVSNKAETEKENTEANGGAIYVYAGAVVNDKNSVYSENTATKGGAIYVAKAAGALAGTLDLSGTQFTSNSSALHGGAICVYNGASFKAELCSFKENSTAGVEANGGALYIYATEASLEDCIFDTNSSTYRGGAVYMSETPDDGEVVTLGCTFSGNIAADNGGAVYLTGTSIWRDGDPTVENGSSEFIGNQAAEGGAVMTHGNAALKGTVFTNNGSEGSGVICVGTGALNVTDVNVVGNECGVYIKNGVFGVGGVTVIDENTDSNVYLASGTYITIIDELDESARIDISAENYNNVLVKPDGSTVTDALAYLDRFVSDMPMYSDGNGNLMTGYIIFEQPTLFNGYIVKASGEPQYAWHIYEDGSIGDALEGQTTNVLVGVVGETYVCVVTYESGEVLVSDPVSYSEIISHPVCGGVCDCGEGHEAIELIPVTNENELMLAGENGGNYYLFSNIEISSEFVVSADVTLSLNGKTLKYVGDNKASVIKVVEGGALTITDRDTTERVGYIDPDTNLWTEGEYAGEGNAVDVTLKGGIVTGGDASSGGAVHVFGSLKTYGGNFINNKANHGGAIYIATGADADIDGVTVAGNIAMIQGGAIRIYETHADISNCIFVGNMALASEANSDNQGGALHIYKSSATVDNCEFIFNSAGYRGGAIYLTQTPAGSEVVTTNCTFTDNTAVNNGGAVYLTGTGIYRDGENGEDNGSDFMGNNTSVSGGAVCVYGSAGFYGSDFDGNYLTGTGNYTYMGGAVAVAGGSAVIDRASFTNNTATSSGGAIAAYGSGVNVTVADSYFESNRASNGGAIYAGGASQTTVTNITAKGNSASSAGAVIYITSDNSVLTLNSAALYNNNTAKNISCGFIHIANAADTLNIYKEEVVMLDIATDSELEITDWSDLLRNPNNATVNELIAGTEG